MDDDEQRCPWHPEEIVDGEEPCPYAEELFDAIVMVPNCPQCLYEARMDI